MKKILFVCLGNICRSPAAEAVMNHLAEQRGVSDLISCDSAGTYGAHAGESADSRMIRHAAKRGISIAGKSRKIKESDLDEFDLILAMDNSNLINIRSMCKTEVQLRKVVKMTDYSQKLTVSEVPDPYYGGSAGFEEVLDILEDACDNLLTEIIRRKV